MDSELKKRYEEALQRIASLSSKFGRDPASVELLAVSKTQPAERIREVYHLGQKSFGENYAQELCSKAEELKDCALAWHFIGHLQSNKIKKIVEHASCIQTVANFRHASLIAKAAHEYGKVPFPIFIEVNPAGEEDKSGVPLSAAEALAQKIQAELPDLRVLGLMAIPPATYQDPSDPSKALPPPLYMYLADAAQGVGEGRLSLGMTGDLALAIAAGSNMVRIGTGIFGVRIRKNS